MENKKEVEQSQFSSTSSWESICIKKHLGFLRGVMSFGSIIIKLFYTGKRNFIDYCTAVVFCDGSFVFTLSAAAEMRRLRI